MTNENAFIFQAVVLFVDEDKTRWDFEIKKIRKKSNKLKKKEEDIFNMCYSLYPQLLENSL